MIQWIETFEYHKQGRIKGGGATGAITPAPPLQKVPRDEINVFQVKYTDLKNFCG